MRLEGILFSQRSSEACTYIPRRRLFFLTTSPPFPHLLAWRSVGEDRDGREDAFLGGLVQSSNRQSCPWILLAGIGRNVILGSVRLFTALWRALRGQSEVTLLGSRRRSDGSLAGCNGQLECHHMEW